MYETAENRYQRDPAYHALVDAIYHCIINMELTPTEVREAAMLACMKFEMTKPRTFFYSQPEYPAPER